jgi:hypothetical protein
MGSASHRFDGDRAQNKARVVMGNVDSGSFRVLVD